MHIVGTAFHTVASRSLGKAFSCVPRRHWRVPSRVQTQYRMWQELSLRYDRWQPCSPLPQTLHPQELAIAKHQQNASTNNTFTTYFAPLSAVSSTTTETVASLNIFLRANWCLTNRSGNIIRRGMDSGMEHPFPTFAFKKFCTFFWYVCWCRHLQEIQLQVVSCLHRCLCVCPFHVLLVAVTFDGIADLRRWLIAFAQRCQKSMPPSL